MAFLLFKVLNLFLNLIDSLCSDSLAMKSATEEQKTTCNQHDIDKDVDCHLLAAIYFEQRDIVSQRDAILADGLQLLDLPIGKAVGGVNLNQDVPSHFVIFSIEVAFYFRRRLDDIEEDYELCCYAHSIGRCKVGQTWYGYYGLYA